ncbi:MAG: GntR family transcriptional regulator [Bacteroidales bacterium]|nr:GntR family transcriptional regulator [Bacteroidales bacterium]
MDFNNTKTIYMQIVDWVFEQVLKEAWQPGDKIPSVRESAVRFEVNPNTVMRSYEYLQQQEVIVNRRGIGFFVAPEAKNIILSIRKKEFLEEEMPLFFKTINLLGISMDEVVSEYNKKNQ